LYGEAANRDYARAKVGVLQQIRTDVILGACVKAAIDSGTCFLKAFAADAPFSVPGSVKPMSAGRAGRIRSADHEAYRARTK